MTEIPRWLMVDIATSSLICTRCRASLPLALPVTLATLADADSAFVRAHRDCKPSNGDMTGGAI